MLETNGGSDMEVILFSKYKTVLDWLHLPGEQPLNIQSYDGIVRSMYIHVLEWPDQSQNLNVAKYLWQDLKTDVHSHLSFNLTELQQFC